MTGSEDDDIKEMKTKAIAGKDAIVAKTKMAVNDLDKAESKDVPGADAVKGDTEDTRTLKQKVMSEVKFFSGLIAFLLVFWTTIFGNFKIPSESMLPTLEVGDHLYVSKFAYGYSRHSMPFNLHKLPFLPKNGKIFSKLPDRGDIVVFRHPYTDMVMIKRVAGIPGDTITVRGGRLIVNGKLLERKEAGPITYRDHKHKSRTIVQSYIEQFEGEKKSHIIYELGDGVGLDNAGVFNVPDGMVFFMGDNRDNSIDSRAMTVPDVSLSDTGPGFVPLDHLMGRADLIMFSFKRCKKETGFYCSGKRFLKPL